MKIRAVAIILVLAGVGAQAQGPVQTVEFPHCPGANQSPSRPTVASRGPTALPKWADGPHCAAGVWGAYPDLVFALAPAKVAVRVPRLWRSTQCPRHIAVRVG